MKTNYIILFVFLISSFSFSQEKDDLFNMIEKKDKQIDLLPEKIIFTQIAFKNQNSKIIDYSFSEIRCDLMDIYLLANCEFYFGGESGPSDISYTFCRPCYGINFPPTYFFESRAHLDSSFIFKRIKNLIPFSKMPSDQN